MTADLSTILLPGTRDDAPALLLPGGPLDRARFREAALALAGVLAGSGARRCLLALADEGRMALAFAAAARAGCEVLLPASHAADHLGGLARTADMVFSDLPGLPGADPWDPAMSGVPLAPAPLDIATVRVTFHTSGSTGDPVAVPRPLAALAAEVASLEAAFAPVSAAVIGSVPPHHIYGFLFRILWPLAAGRAIVPGTQLHPHELAVAARAHPGAIFVSSPAFLKRAHQVLDVAAVGARLALTVSSGGPLPPAVAAWWNGTAGSPLVEVFGSTETGGIGHRVVRDAAAPPPWTPLPGVHAVRDAGTGRLRLRSPHLAGGAEWLCADIIGEPDPDGRFTLLGRADRVVKVEECRVSLDEVEQALSGLPGVGTVRVLPLHKARRTALAAVVVPTEDGWEALSRQGRRAMVAAMAGRLRQALPVPAVPRHWRFVSAFPENAQGKTTVAALEALFRAAAGREVTPEAVSEMVGDGTADLVLRVPGSLCFFDGHFDAAPILPGVAQLGWAIGEATARFAGGQPFLRLEAVKFFQVVVPGTELRLALSGKPGSGKVGFEFTSAGGRHSSGRIVFGPAEGVAA